MNKHRRMSDDNRPVAFVGLGSNLGDRIQLLADAAKALECDPRVSLVALSPVYESAAHLQPTQPKAPDFLNAVVKIDTEYDPLDLLDVCLDIERRLGRDRQSENEDKPWPPRSIDIDILVYDSESRSDHRLTIPHPRLHERRFVLLPLCDIDPDLHVPPPFDSTAAQLLAACTDQARIRAYHDLRVERHYGYGVPADIDLRS